MPADSGQHRGRRRGAEPLAGPSPPLAVLRPTPGALNSRLLEERPADLPAHLFVSGGRQQTCFSAVLFEPEGPRLLPLESPEQLHQRVSVVLGSKNEVERVTQYYAQAASA